MYLMSVKDWVPYVCPQTTTLQHLIFDNYFRAPYRKDYITEIVLELFLRAVILIGIWVITIP